MKRIIPLLLVVVVAFSIACGSDDSPVKPQTPIVPIEAAKKQDVLSNIEYAYNKRNVAVYDKQLDDNFTFYLAPHDVGGTIPASWGRADEMTISGHLFDKNFAALPAQSIYMDIKSENVAWSEVVSGDETWYSTVLYYDFKFDIGPNIYIPDTGSKAEFVVRNAGTAGAPNWKLVEMRDLGGSTLAATASRATEPTTWGQVKAMYR